MPKTSIRPRSGKIGATPTTDFALAARGLVRRDGRPDDVVAFEEQVIGFFIEAAELIGAPKSVAAIYGICFASSEPLGFAEIQERLDISSGSISQGLRVLRDVGALKVAVAQREKLKNGNADTLKSEEARDVLSVRQRERYEPDLELRKLVLHWIEKRLQKQLSSGSSRLEQLMHAVPAGAGAPALRERLGALQTWHDKSHALMPIVKTFLKLT